MIKRKWWLLLFVSVTLMLSFVSAEMYISEPDPVYNYGDELNFNVRIFEEGDGPFEIRLVCGSDEKSLVYDSQLVVEDNKTVEKSYTLSNDFLKDMDGIYNIEASYNNESVKGSDFEITRDIEVSLGRDRIVRKVGDVVEIYGDAVKENGDDVDGFLNFSLKEADLNLIREVRGGDFFIDFTLPVVEPGNYSMKFNVYEKDGEITNYGTGSIPLTVEQTATNLEIISNESVVPGENFVLMSVILDQVGEIMEGEIGLIIMGKEESIYQDIVDSGDEVSLPVSNTEEPNFWQIEANGSGLGDRKVVDVEELEKANFDIRNETLHIENIGNVEYQRSIKVLIGDEKVVKNINLGVGDSMALKLSAPEGEYNVTATDGMETFSGFIYLTGQVVGVDEFRESAGLIAKYPVVWTFLILVLGGLIFVLSKKMVRKKSYSYPVENDSKERKKSSHNMQKEEGEKSSDGLDEKQKVLDVTDKKVNYAEHSLVLNGSKEDVAVLTLRIDNGNDKGKIKEIIDMINENNGAAYETSDYLFGIFSSLTTKTFENEMLAIDTAKKIKEGIKDDEEIKYGVGLNSGQLILEKKDILKFTNVGSTINMAKKVAGLADSEILLSDDFYKKVGSEIKAEKENRKGMQVYNVKKVGDRKKYKKFINEFLERNKGDVNGLGKE